MTLNLNQTRTMEETSSGLGYNYKHSDDDGGSVGIAAGTEGGGGGTRAMMFVSAVAADAGDGARDNRDESGNDSSAFQQSMPPQHHQLPPPRSMLPNPFQNVVYQQQQQQPPPIPSSVPLPTPVPSAAIPNLILSSASDPKEEIGVNGNCTNPIEKARAIAMRFQQETLQKQQQLHPSNYAAINDTSIPNNIAYAQLRHQYFQQERNKLQMFTLKNLEYIMKHEEGELRKHVTIMNEMVAYEEQQDIQLQLRQEQQKQYQLTQRHRQEQREIIGIMNEGSGGIGSVEQRRAERARRKRHQSGTASASSSLQHHQHQSSDNVNKMRTSLYLTNLPTDGSITERTLQSLFCSYGRLDRVTMYRHRDSGMLKGDGLIVFGRDAVEEYHQHREDGNTNNSSSSNNNNVVADLVEAVCAQMNGAELPSGHVMGVQPAQMDYLSKKKQAIKNDGHEKCSTVYGKGAIDEANTSLSVAEELDQGVPDVSDRSDAMVMMSDAKIPNKVEDNLDDFFASLG